MKNHFLKIDKAAELIDVSPWTIRKWIKHRKIRTYRFGGSVRIKESDLLAFAKVTHSVNNGTETLIDNI
ncbi:hypothetical protein BVY01_05230 [bacterium I07]|nr:hypothetical protein BVY01_05230 [bacterium I07]